MATVWAPCKKEVVAAACTHLNTLNTLITLNTLLIHLYLEYRAREVETEMGKTRLKRRLILSKTPTYPRLPTSTHARPRQTTP